MKDREIGDILKQAADAQSAVDPALVDRISKLVSSDLRPVRELPPSWILSGGLVLACGIVAIAVAAILGPHGIRKMTGVEIALIFSVLALLIWLAAKLCVATAIPGSRRPISGWLLGVSGCLGLAAVFGLLFHDYGIERFVPQGMACLIAGLATAIPASLAIWLLLRRGFSVNVADAGFANGALAGLAGIAMLELHCPNFEVTHVIVWHIAVLPIGALIGRFIARKIGG